MKYDSKMLSDEGRAILFLRGSEGNHRRLATNNASTSDEISSSSPYPPDWIIFTICFGAWFIAALAIRLCCMKFLSNKFEPCHEREFDCAISEAEAKTHRRRIQQKKKKRNNLQIAQRPEKQEIPSALAYTTFEFYDADFLLTYTDETSHQTKTGFARLTLKNNGSGYTVSGMCADSGSAHIQDGFCAYSGEAWWVTRSQETDGLRVLSTGQFNFGTNRFEGTWRDNKGSKGKYIRFESTRVFVSSSTEIPAETSVLTSEENIRRGSSIFVGNTTEYGEA